ncbi:hypothetical protein ACU8L5_06505 [Rhizobium leguminosarum]|uniref:Lipoprotein n=1 Tax=Rhizobium leguminosarum TaxID=384 RepID=A0A444IMD0_RHILE|nr:hypothetical protein [Rhizobium leguminosarum]MDH6659600.1 hypothetical protein [Rhizobium sophorae]ASS53589.1 hypothetical protein CHR56_02785 [Rhizobium leguminosarum bv. viciae]AVC49195.1 hypothetical protein RLV_4033 [Rhizobium leguminosarum bv. viciae]MBA9036311.1 hypothetical protein [Rhizobium leguminosarum]MBB4327353.1 hypothetical protein [Rhizobium leguminosarum]
MRKYMIVTVAAAGLLLAGCQRQAENLVEVTGHLFVFNYRVASATYLLTLKKTGPIPDGSVIIAEFENPEGGDPLVLNQKIYPIDDKIALQSEKLHCVRKDRPYSVSVRLVDKDGKVLQELKTQFRSDLDQTVLPSKPLVLGALYEKNPEVFKPDGSVDFSNTDKCPA